MNFELYLEKLNLAFDAKNLDEDIDRFIRNFRCSCNEKVMLPSGLQYCCHLANSVAKKFGREELLLARKGLFLRQDGKIL